MKRKMFFLLTLAAALCLSLMPVSSWAEDSESYSDNSGTYDGHTYQVFNNGISWTQAKDFCEAEGGHLVTITSQEEQDYINEQLLSGTMKHCYWIGLYRENGTSNWRWVNGEEFSFANWARNEPNNMDQKEDYAELFGKNFVNSSTQKFLGEWNDATDTGAEYSGECYALKNTGFICEWDSDVIVEPVEPVTLNTVSAKVAVGKSMTLEAYGPDDIAFKSSNKAVATVTSAGKVSAVKPGTATITAFSKTDKTNKATCKITVKYKLTYKMDGGKNSADNPTWYTGKVTLKNPKARKGYDFKGWYTDSKFKTKVTYVKNANKTLYAKWEWHSYSIKFVKNGGTGSQYYQRCRYGKEFNLPECHYTRKGYTFTGWNTKADGSGKAYADKASFKNLSSKDGATVSLYAQWKVRKYTIKYSGLPEGAKNDNKTSYTINTATFSLKDASCPGYTFMGWFSDSKKTKPVTSIKKGSTGSKTIYSKWAAHKYTIKFNANGGTGTMGSMKSCAYGKKYALTNNAFTMPRYLFKEWNTNADGSGTAYADGAEVSNLVTKDGGSITLYAQWMIAADLTDPDIYMKQNAGSSNCTLYACAHMMRRKAILDGRTDWTIINSDAVEDADSLLARAVWVNGQGLKAEFSYKMAEGYILNGHCVEIGSMGKERLIQLLKDHPEGIECYDMYTANPNMAHGVLVTSYDAATGIFYCVDSDPGQPAGIIPLSECLIGDHHGNTQDNALANIGKYWYLD